VTPEALLFLDKARQSLAIADYVVEEWPAEAGRAAYLAAFHAAQALIAEKTGRAVKTHKGVNVSFQRLTMGDNRIDRDLRGFLSRGYDLKVSADYGTGPDGMVSEAAAHEAMATAKRFVIGCEAAILATDRGTEPPYNVRSQRSANAKRPRFTA
jgi:uncharacterized protein (UPF0332 family)